MKLILASLLLLLPFAAAAQTCTTATCTAAGVTEAQFLAALPSSSNTNATVVVNIPSGTSNWTTGFSYTVPSAVTTLTIQGATTVSCTGTAGSSGYACSATDNTIIGDAYVSSTPLMTFTVGGSSSHFRVTGLTFKQANSTTGASKSNGWINFFSGSSQNVRVDHNDFNTTTGTYNQVTTIRTFTNVAGVVDHNVWNFVSGQFDFGVSDFGPTVSTGDDDTAWASATQWGSGETLYVEQNQLLGGGEINDCGNGGSMVVRYNTMNSSNAGVQTHATKSDAGPQRGCRMIEIYKNYISQSTGTDGDSPAGIKGNPAMIWGNTMAANSFFRFFTPATDRNINPANVNENAGQPTDWGYCGTAINGTGSTWDGNQTASLGYPCMDGVGRGQGDLLNNAGTIAARLNTTTGTQSWPHQKLEPVYLFANTVTPASGVEVQPRDQTTTADRDYYSECNTGFSDSTCPSTAFNGSHGTGSGLLSVRPSTCTPGPGGTFGTSPTGSYGVGYFATDANSGNGELYVCTATNTWTGIYQPYTYPHPLVSSLTPTSTSLGASTTTPAPGTNVVLTATITPSSGPTGTVTFFDGGSSIGIGSVSSGVATFTVTAITAGTHTYTATYSGDGTFASSTSSPITVTATGVITGGITPGIKLGGGVVIR